MNNKPVVCVRQRFPSLTAPPPSREWSEVSVYPELCLGVTRRALSRLDATVRNGLDRLKEDGEEMIVVPPLVTFTVRNKIKFELPFLTEMKRMQRYAGMCGATGMNGARPFK